MLRTVIAFCAVLGVSVAGIAAEVTYRKDIRPLMVQSRSGFFHRLARHRRRIREQGAARTPCGNLPRVR